MQERPCRQTRGSAFVVPFGCDDKSALVPPRDANPARLYRCPACASLLAFKYRGSSKRPHFAHRPHREPDAAPLCSREAALHVTAKRLVAAAVADRGRVDPCLTFPCLRCKEPAPLKLAPEIERAEIELRLPNGLVADVALLTADGDVMCAVEVCKSHAVSSEKATEYGATSVEWLEVLAADIVANPWIWKVQRASFPLCLVCERRRRGRIEWLHRVNTAMDEQRQRQGYSDLSTALRDMRP